MIFFIYEKFLFVLFCMPSGTPFLPLIRALSITFVRFLLYYFSIFQLNVQCKPMMLFVISMQYFSLPLFLFVPHLHNCTFDAEEFVKSVVHKMSGIDFCASTVPQKEQHPSIISATFSLEGRGGISRKMIKGPQYKRTASFFPSPPYDYTQ